MQEAANNKEALTLVMWIGGAAVAAWNGLLTLLLLNLLGQVKETRENIKAVSVEREDHCVNQNECARTHQAVETRLDSIETGIAGISARLDVLMQRK